MNKTPGGAAYYHLTVKKIIRETDDAISIVFDNPGNEITYKPGQFITLVLKMGEEEIRKPYSLSSSPDDGSDLVVTLKKADAGKVSAYLVDELEPGNKIKVLAPAGNFTIDFEANNDRTFIFFAGGSGISPLMSILKTALVREPHSKIILIYQNRREETIILKKTIDGLLATYPDRIHVIHILSQPSNSWKGLSGRLNPDLIKNIFLQYGVPLHNSAIFICGPGALMDMIESTLDDLGFNREIRYKETFYSKEDTKELKDDPDPAEKEYFGSTVTILLDNEEHILKIKSDEFILETALDADLNMPFSCQSGICTTCRGKLISGEVIMEDPEGLSEEEMEAGYILTCVSHPDSKELKIKME
jgi:ring-1,2-phenylacetyl-CoA epoxidase subunit PaaE